MDHMGILECVITGMMQECKSPSKSVDTRHKRLIAAVPKETLVIRMNALLGRCVMPFGLEAGTLDLSLLTCSILIPFLASFDSYFSTSYCSLSFNCAFKVTFSSMHSAQ
jgi:hypothetical protein